MNDWDFLNFSWKLTLFNLGSWHYHLNYWIYLNTISWSRIFISEWHGDKFKVNRMNPELMPYIGDSFKAHAILKQEWDSWFRLIGTFSESGNHGATILCKVVNGSLMLIWFIISILQNRRMPGPVNGENVNRCYSIRLGSLLWYEITRLVLATVVLIGNHYISWNLLTTQ